MVRSSLRDGPGDPSCLYASEHQILLRRVIGAAFRVEAAKAHHLIDWVDGLPSAAAAGVGLGALGAFAAPVGAVFALASGGSG